MSDPQMRAVIVEAYEGRMGQLSKQLADGDISIGEFQMEMRAELRDAFALQLRAGADGEIANTDDYLKLGNVVKSQYGYLEQFARDIKAGDISGDGIANRAKLYAQSSGQMYWRQAFGDVELPAYPQDGSSPCLGRCACEWVDNHDGSYAWALGEADHCEVCKERSEMWNPYTPRAERMAA